MEVGGLGRVRGYRREEEKRKKKGEDEDGILDMYRD